jgi:thioredoxin reductase (NADPH)
MQQSTLPESPDGFGAFPRLSDEQIAALERHGEHRATHEGEVLFREGDSDYDLFVVLSGKVAVVDGYGQPHENVIAVHGPHRFLGELSLLTGQPAFFTAVVGEPGEVLDVPVDRLRALVAQDSALGDVILRAFLLRREMLIGLGAGFRIIGSRYSPDTRRLRDFAARNRLPHRWIDLEDDPQAEELLRQLGVTPDQTPVVLWRGSVLRNPSNGELAAVLGLRAPSPQNAVEDLIVVGSGPAGLAAAVYGASEGLVTVALDVVAAGGQAATSSRIENYLGFPSGISGAELAERAVIQAEKFGARITVPVGATGLSQENGHHVLHLDDRAVAHARTVVLATGARYRRLDVPGLARLEGTSVFYAATVMEAQLCVNDPIVVVGGGNSAGQATLYLSRYAARVQLVVREDDLSENMSRYLADRIERIPNVEILLHHEVRELTGDHALEAVVVQDRHSGERHTIPARSMFVFIGALPCTDWLAGQVALDESGYVVTGHDVTGAAAEAIMREAGRPPLLLETSCPGVFAVGDVRSGSIKRVASAVGEGSMAVRLVFEHLEDRHVKAAARA